MPNAPDRRSAFRWLRQRLGPRLDRVARTLFQPTVRVYPSEYVGTVHAPIDRLEAELHDAGFTWDPLSAYHYTPAGESTDGSWAYRSRLFADRQLHVVLFAQRSDRTDVYAHDEFNLLRHPIKHVREVDIRRSVGAAEVRRWLEARGVTYERDSVARRRIRHLFKRIQASLRNAVVQDGRTYRRPE